jgi:uncharacterized protein YjiS (DUF1127 family)
MHQTALTRTSIDHARDLWQDLAHWWRAALERRRQRRALVALDDHLLRDIGISREQARTEAARPFWR